MNAKQYIFFIEMSESNQRNNIKWILPPPVRAKNG